MIETFSMVASTAGRPLLRSWSAQWRSAHQARFSLLRGAPDRSADGVLQPFQRELAVDAPAVDVELRGGVDAVPEALLHVLLDLRGVGGAVDFPAEPVQVQAEVAGVPEQ